MFTEADDQADLPPPTSLNDLQSASLEQKAMMSLQPHNMRIEEAMPGDEPSYYDPPPQPVQMPPPTAAWAPQSAGPDTVDYRTQAQEDEEERRIRERAEERERAQQAQAAAKGTTGPMRIRNDYVPRAQAKRQNVAMALCPNCKQQIPYDELEQHMRSKFYISHSLIGRTYANILGSRTSRPSVEGAEGEG
jgi:splicing factor 3A subunit 1